MLGQIPSQGEIERELKKRDLDEQEIRKRMMERGIDIDNVDPTKPVEVALVNATLREVVEEIERERKMEKEKQNGGIQNDDPVKELAHNPDEAVEKIKEKDAEETTEKIKEAVKEGATIEEAVSEEISDELEVKLPPAKNWGQQIFRDKSIRVYRESKDVKPPDSYILGIGDYVTVSIWGYSQENIVFEINDEGYIKPERMPRIYLKGITLGKAKKLLESRFSNYFRFRPEEFELTLNFSRTITVNVVGEVFNYGSYTIPAINTAFNALVAAGGPTNIGSVRKIKLYRAGKETKTIDIYKFLLNPATQEELFLEENDFIHVPIADKIVQIKGAVNRPNRYELIEGENLVQLIKYAGGLQDDALRGNIQIKRIENDREIIIDANLEELRRNNKDFELKASDVVSINRINKGVDNFVEVAGAIEFPGEYAFTPNIRISDLLNRAVLKNEARKDIAFLQRKNIDGTVEYVKIDLGALLINKNSASNLKLRVRDKLIIYSLDKFTDKMTIKIIGNARTPGVFPYDRDDSLSVSDLVLLGDGLNPNASRFGYIKRFDITNKEVKDYIKVDLFTAINDPQSSANILLRPFDELTIFEKENYTDENTVSIIGAVRTPNKYDFTKGMRISDLVYLSDGLKQDATSFAYLKRRNPSKEKLIEYVRINLIDAIENPNNSSDLLLEPGDELTTFSRQLFTDGVFVTINGSVRKPGEYRYDESLQIKDIITMAGGLTIEAAKNKIDIFRIEFNENEPTQTVTKTIEVDNNYELIGSPNFRIQPFDQIVVRKVPDFEFQKNVVIRGEVFYPGTYAILNEDEPLSSLVARSGGLTDFAFPEGAKLYRMEDSIGYVIIELNKVLQNKNSVSNIILKSGDVLQVPKTNDLVSIEGFTRSNELYFNDMLSKNRKINIPFSGKRRALGYIRKHAGGVGKYGSKKQISVEYPNGETKRARNFGFFVLTPRIKAGSKISVGQKKVSFSDELKENEKNKVDWEEVFSKTITQVTSLLTLILLVQRLD